MNCYPSFDNPVEPEALVAARAAAYGVEWELDDVIQRLRGAGFTVITAWQGDTIEEVFVRAGSGWAALNEYPGYWTVNPVDAEDDGLRRNFCKAVVDRENELGSFERWVESDIITEHHWLDADLREYSRFPCLMLRVHEDFVSDDDEDLQQERWRKYRAAEEALTRRH